MLPGTQALHRARADDDAGRAAQLMQILREWRGGLHLVATTAGQFEAILLEEQLAGRVVVEPHAFVRQSQVGQEPRQ